ncbi:hypothetical protein [Candidatus Palauibacter sp.]
MNSTSVSRTRVERADERATNGEGSKLGRFIKFSMDVAHCTADYISPFN